MRKWPGRWAGGTEEVSGRRTKRGCAVKIFALVSILARGSFTSLDDLAAKVHAYVERYLKTDQPFHWNYRPKSWRA